MNIINSICLILINMLVVWVVKVLFRITNFIIKNIERILSSKLIVSNTISFSVSSGFSFSI